MNKFIILVLSSSLLFSCNTIPKENEKLGYQGFNTEGQSVIEKLEELKEDQDFTIRSQSGWIIASSSTSNVTWTFTPESHPAHPSYVKRDLIQKEGSFHIETSARCGAEKVACDNLIKEFKDLDEQIRKQISGS